MTEPRPFRSQVFLFRMLAAIFFVEAGFLAFAFVKCSTPMPGNPVPLVNERCPKLGERSETLFVAAITTTLSLLTGAGVAVSQKKSSSDRALPSGEQPRQLPRRRSPEKTFEERAQGQASEAQVEPQEQASLKASASGKEKKQPRDKR